MNAEKILVGEFALATGFVSFCAIRGDKTVRYAPWPPTLIKIAASFSIFGFVAVAAPEFAAAFGAGVILAAFLKLYSQKGGIGNYFGGAPTPTNGTSVGPYEPLSWEK